MHSGSGMIGGGNGGSPQAIKRCIEERQSDFQGSLQQDAHEFLAALLEQLHTEAVRGDSSSCGGLTSLPLTATSCPTFRNFSFCIEHQVTCGKCGKANVVTEQYRDLSLEVPLESPADTVFDLQQLVADHLKDETVEKSCDLCGGENCAHSVRHRLRRLPRILTLHLKRFQAQPSATGGAPRFSKLHSRVAVPDILELGGLLADATSLPLPLGPPLEQLPSAPNFAEDKENDAAAAGGHGVAAEPDDPSHAFSLPATLASQVPGSDLVEQRQLAAALEQSLAASWAESPRGIMEASESSPSEDELADTPGLKGGGASDADFDAMVSDTPPERPPFSKTSRMLMPTRRALFQQGGGEDDKYGPSTVDLVTDNDEEDDDAQLQHAIQISMMMAASEQVVQPALEQVGAGDSSAATSPASLIDSFPSDPRSTAACPGAVQRPLEVYHMTEPPLPSREDAATCHEAVYELRGVVNHLGMTSKSGHFTAHVKEPGSGRWFVHNDTSTTLLLQGDPAFEARQQDCYILFFQHCGQPTLE